MTKYLRAPTGRVGLCALAGLALALVGVELVHPIAFHEPALSGAGESATTLCAAAAAGLVAVRFRHTRSSRDLLYFGMFCTVVFVEFFSYVPPEIVGAEAGRRLEAGLMLGWFAIAVAMAAHPFVSRSRLRTGSAHGQLALAAGAGFVTATAACLGGLVIGAAVARPDATGAQQGLGAAAAHPLPFALAFLSAGALAVAASRYARAQTRRPEYRELLLAAGCVVLMAAMLQYLAEPALTPDWATARAGLTLIWLALALGSAIFLEVERRRVLAVSIAQQSARQAVQEERRRMSWDLHDGLAQDLAFIASQGERFALVDGTEHPVALAARRALLASRAIVADLAASKAPTLAAALGEVGEELAGRFEINVEVDAGDVSLGAGAREDVVRIAREAIANAARHGRARNVLVSLAACDDGVRLLVRDDGCGFANAVVGGHSGIAGFGGFGVQMMRARATARGGRLTTRISGERRNELEVVLP